MKGWILLSAIGWAAIFASQFVLSVPARQTEKDREVTVKLDAALDVRSSPSLSSKRLGTIRAGQAVTILEYRADENIFSVRYKKTIGFVDAARIPRTNAVESLMAAGKSMQVQPKDAPGAGPAKLDDRAAKRQVLTMLYGERAASRIMEGKTWIGMSKEMVIQSIGEPQSVRRVVFSNIIKEHWKYADGRDLYFENDALKAIGGLPPGIQPLEPTSRPPAAGGKLPPSGGE